MNGGDSTTFAGADPGMVTRWCAVMNWRRLSRLACETSSSFDGAGWSDETSASACFAGLPGAISDAVLLNASVLRARSASAIASSRSSEASTISSVRYFFSSVSAPIA